MPTREFDLLKTILAPLGQLTAAGLVAAWLTPHWTTAAASLSLIAMFGVALRRLYALIRKEEMAHGTP